MYTRHQNVPRPRHLFSQMQFKKSSLLVMTELKLIQKNVFKFFNPKQFFWHFEFFLPSTPPLSNFDTSIHVRTSCHWLYIIQSVPPICWQLQTQFCNSRNRIFQKVTLVLKTLWKNLSGGTLKLNKVKSEVFLNWLSKQFLKQQKIFLHHAGIQKSFLLWVPNNP